MQYRVFIYATILLLSACAQYQIVTPQQITVKGISVIPTQSWSKTPLKTGPKTETWTMDGLALNELVFIGGVNAGESLFKSNNKELPMPEFKQAMLPNELEDLVLTSVKNVTGGELDIHASNMRPQPIGEQMGFRFNLDFYTSEGLAKKGDVLIAIKDNQLYAMVFLAPSLHYFDTLQAEIDAIYTSAII